MNLFASSRFFLKLTMIASFQKTNLKIGDIIIKWYSTTNTLQTQGSGLPLCKQNWSVYSAKDELLTLQTSNAYMSVDFNLMTAFLVPVVRRLISANSGEKSKSVFFCSNAFSLFLEHQKVDLLTITGRLSLLLKLSHLNSKFRQTLGYLNKALNNPAQFQQVLQSNLSNTDTEGTEQSVRIREVSVV